MKSDLFIECAKNVVDSYNLMQESIGSKNRMEYPVVKEVKPREWWVNMHKGSGNNYFCETKDEAIRTMWGVPEYNHIIKVREVIE